MRYVAAALLASLAGNEINAENIEKILSSVGVESDAEKVKVVVANTAGKSLDELIAMGAGKLAAVGGGGGAAPAGGAPAAAAGEAAPAAEEKKEEEPEEEEDDDMGFGLFD